MGVLRLEQALIQRCFIGQQQKPLGVRIKAADWIHGLWELKVRERTIG
jgi:hypothetical protein